MTADNIGGVRDVENAVPPALFRFGEIEVMLVAGDDVQIAISLGGINEGITGVGFTQFSESQVNESGDHGDHRLVMGDLNEKRPVVFDRASVLASVGLT